MVETSHGTGFWPSLYEPFRTLGTRVADWFAPASEAASNDDGYRIVMELPGVAEDAIDVSVSGQTVTIKGEKSSSREETGETWYFSERQYGAFQRSFRLPPDADAESLSADLKDGVLTIRVARKTETDEAGARRIAVTKG